MKEQSESRGFVMTAFGTNSLFCYQQCREVLVNQNQTIGEVTPVLKNSKECFVLLLVPELFLLCPVSHGNGRSNPWNREEKKKKTKTFSSPPSLENKSPLDLIFSQSFSCPFFMSSEDGEQVLGSATQGTYWHRAPAGDSGSLRARAHRTTTAL